MDFRKFVKAFMLLVVFAFASVPQKAQADDASKYGALIFAGSVVGGIVLTAAAVLVTAAIYVWRHNKGIKDGQKLTPEKEREQAEVAQRAAAETLDKSVKDVVEPISFDTFAKILKGADLDDRDVSIARTAWTNYGGSKGLSIDDTIDFVKRNISFFAEGDATRLVEDITKELEALKLPIPVKEVVGKMPLSDIGGVAEGISVREVITMAKKFGIKSDIDINNIRKALQGIPEGDYDKRLSFDDVIAALRKSGFQYPKLVGEIIKLKEAPVREFSAREESVEAVAEEAVYTEAIRSRVVTNPLDWAIMTNEITQGTFVNKIRTSFTEEEKGKYKELLDRLEAMNDRDLSSAEWMANYKAIAKNIAKNKDFLAKIVDVTVAQVVALPALEDYKARLFNVFDGLIINLKPRVFVDKSAEEIENAKVEIMDGLMHASPRELSGYGKIKDWDDVTKIVNELTEISRARAAVESVSVEGSVRGDGGGYVKPAGDVKTGGDGGETGVERTGDVPAVEAHGV